MAASQKSIDAKEAIEFKTQGCRAAFIERWNTENSDVLSKPAWCHRGREGYFAVIDRHCINSDYWRLCDESKSYEKGYLDAMLVMVTNMILIN